MASILKSPPATTKISGNWATFSQCVTNFDVWAQVSVLLIQSVLLQNKPKRDSNQWAMGQHESIFLTEPVRFSWPQQSLTVAVCYNRKFITIICKPKPVTLSENATGPNLR